MSSIYCARILESKGMTEQVWLEATDLTPKFAYLKDRASERKLRLFCCACCRSMWHLLHKRSRKAISVADAFVEEMAPADELTRARNALRQNKVWRTASRQPGARNAFQAAWLAAEIHVNVSACWQHIVSAKLDEDEELSRSLAESQLTPLFLDVFGNPFRPVTIDPRWLTSNVVDLATAIYNERAFDRIPILGDALMDAGCDNDEIITHCRSGDLHVRGCWVVDLLLGKE